MPIWLILLLHTCLNTAGIRISLIFCMGVDGFRIWSGVRPTSISCCVKGVHYISVFHWSLNEQFLLLNLVFQFLVILFMYFLNHVLIVILNNNSFYLSFFFRLFFLTVICFYLSLVDVDVHNIIITFHFSPQISQISSRRWHLSKIRFFLFL